MLTTAGFINDLADDEPELSLPNTITMMSNDDMDAEELARQVVERHTQRAQALAALSERQAQVADWLSLIIASKSDEKLFMIRVKVHTGLVGNVPC